jgi:hypothetical protein
VLWLSVEVYLRHIDTLYIEKQKGLMADADSMELLILGNSHEDYGIDPKQFDCNAYNMAQVDQSLYFDKRVTLKYIDHLVKLKYVLIGVDFHSLYFSDEGPRDEWVYYGYGLQYKDKLGMLSTYCRVYGYTPMVAKGFIENNIKHWLHKTPIKAVDVELGVDTKDTMYRGWVPYDKTDYSSMSNQFFSTRASSFNELCEKSTEKNEVIADLEDFINELQKRGITPILMTLPIYKDFATLLDTNIIRQNDSEIAMICQKYNLQYWDYSTLPFDKSDFHDGDHLDKQGAQKFSAILNKQFKQIYQ